MTSTATGIGSDGREYTIVGHHEKVHGGGPNDYRELASIIKTIDGEPVYCESESPLVFVVRRTGMKITCTAPLQSGSA